MSRQEYNYYAFISYSRKDEKWAAWIQRKLETYRFPAVLKRENRFLPGKIFPIFRDKTDLSSGVLSDELHYQIESSEYLIVICSPASAQSYWVNQEVLFFKSLGRVQNIIPLIVEGEPHATDSSRECCCPALLDQEDEELLGVNVQESGKKGALLRVIASMMHLRYDQLAMRDRRRSRRRGLIAAVAVTAALALSFMGIWYEMPHNDYYWSIVYRNEVPVGVEKLSAQEQASADQFYKLITQRGRVVRLELVNSAGGHQALMGRVRAYDDINNTANHPIAAFSYRDSGVLDSVTYYDEQSEPQYTAKYSQNLNAVDFINPLNDTAVAGLFPSSYTAAGGIIYSSEISSSSEITRKLLTFDDNGYLCQELYMWDNRNTPVCDRYGVYGKRYDRDGKGQILRVTHLDKDGEPLHSQYGTSVSYYDYTYDDCGRITKVAFFDSDGHSVTGNGLFASEVLEYDSAGRLSCINLYDRNGLPCLDSTGISRYRFGYDEKGFPAYITYLDETDYPVFAKGYGYHRVDYQCDELGRVIEASFRDTLGNACVDNEGTASFSREYDEAGRIIAEWNYGLDGDLAFIPGLNGAGYTVEFPDEYTKRRTYYDRNGQIALTANGYAIYEEKRNAQGMLERLSYYDTLGRPCRSNENIAVIRYVYDDTAHLTEISFYDEEDQPCLNVQGIARARYTYDQYGNRNSAEFLNTEGSLCFCRSEKDDIICARWESDFDALGHPISLRHYGPDGTKLYINGTAEARFEYDERGICIATSYHDHLGNLCNRSSGYAREELTYNQDGHQTSCLLLDRNGSPIAGTYQVLSEYDERGNVTKQTSSIQDDEGNKSQIVDLFEYDSRDNQISCQRLTAQSASEGTKTDIISYKFFYDDQDREIRQECYDGNGAPVNCEDGYAIVEQSYDEHGRIAEQSLYRVSDDESAPTLELWARYTLSYDGYGNRTELWQYDSDGNIVCDDRGVACTVKTYDVMGNVIQEHLLGPERQPISCPDGYSSTVHTYDAAGHEIQQSFYDTQGFPVTAESGCPACVLHGYNAYGFLTESEFLDDTGKHFPQPDGTVRTVYSYSPMGVQTAAWSYDRNDDLLQADVTVMYVDEVYPETQGGLAGVQAGDIVIQYADWKYYGFENYNIDLEGFTARIQLLSDKNKTVILCREDTETGSMLFQEYHFTPGMLGLRIVDQRINWEAAEKIRSAYEAYQAL